MVSRSRLIVAAIMIGFLGATEVSAVPITFSFTGTVTSASGVFAGQGSTVTGFYTYDTALVDSDAIHTRDVFRSDVVSNYTLLWDISVTVGSTTRTTASNHNASGTLHHALDIHDTTIDRFELFSFRVVGSDDSARISLQDFSPSPPDAIGVGSGNLVGIAPVSAPNLSLFDTLAGLSNYHAYDGVGVLEGQVFFTPTSISLIPEPSTALLVASGLLGLAARRREIVR